MTLRSDPTKHDAWQRRSRERAAERAREKPRTPLPAGKPLVSATQVKPRNEKNRARAFARAFGSEDRVLAVQALECMVPRCTERSENCHTRGRRNATWRDVFNACHEHHREQHDIGIKTWARKYQVDPWARAAELAKLIPVQGEHR